MIEVFPRERWPELTDIFREVFDTYLPQDNSTILAECDENGKVTKFMVMEVLMKIGQVWNTGNQSRAMFDFFDEKIVGGTSVIAMPCSKKLERLCERFGMYKAADVVYRKDF